MVLDKLCFALIINHSNGRSWFLHGSLVSQHDDVMKWKHFPRYWPFVRGIHRSPANFLQKGQWRGALMFSLICAWINGWVNTRKAGDLRRHHPHYVITLMNNPTHLWWHIMSLPLKIKVFSHQRTVLTRTALSRCITTLHSDILIHTITLRLTVFEHIITPILPTHIVQDLFNCQWDSEATLINVS